MRSLFLVYCGNVFTATGWGLHVRVRWISTGLGFTVNYRAVILIFVEEM
jgi:hypothetical protein